MMFVEVEGKGRNAARDHLSFGVRSFVATSTGGSLNIRSGLGVGCGNGGGACLHLERATAAARDLVERFFLRNYVLQCMPAAVLKRTKLKLVLRSPTKRVWGELFFLDVYRNVASYTSNLKCVSGLRRLRQPFALILSTRTRCWLRTDIHDDEPGWIYINIRGSPSAFLLVVGHFPSSGETWQS